MQEGEPGLLKPTLVAGSLFGLLGSGAFASYLHSRACARSGTEFGAGKGAVVGLIAGAFYGISAAIFEWGIVALVGEPGLVWLLETIRGNANTPAATVEMIDEGLRQMGQRAVTVGSFVVSVFSSILVGALFSTLGGLIGGALFPTPPAPPVPPVAAPAD
jgi:hypothetical protein